MILSQIQGAGLSPLQVSSLAQRAETQADPRSERTAMSVIGLRGYYILDKHRGQRVIVATRYGLKVARRWRDTLQAQADAKGEGSVSRMMGTDGKRFCITKIGG